VEVAGFVGDSLEGFIAAAVAGWEGAGAGFVGVEVALEDVFVGSWGGCAGVNIPIQCNAAICKIEFATVR